MKLFILLAFIVLGISCASGCATDPVVQERMVIAPDTIVFRTPSADSTISITHTCSCPFSWKATLSPAMDTTWLTFPTYQSGDKKDVPISINRAKLLADTNRATLSIASNSYGTDSIVVIAVR
jgi:hypothetical protein